MDSKYRYIVIGLVVIAGAGLVITGHLTGEQWANTIGGILLGGAGTSVASPLHPK